MQVREADEFDVFKVALHMRDSDFREFSAMYPAESKEQLAAMMSKRYSGRSDLICACTDDGEPVAIGAMIEARPRVTTLFFFATDNLPKIGLSLTRFLKTNLFPRMRDAGIHRFECISIEGHDDAHRWIMALGMKPETEPLLGYGKNGERFIQFSWVSDDVRKACA